MLLPWLSPGKGEMGKARGTDTQIVVESWAKEVGFNWEAQQEIPSVGYPLVGSEKYLFEIVSNVNEYKI